MEISTAVRDGLIAVPVIGGWQGWVCVGTELFPPSVCTPRHQEPQNTGLQHSRPPPQNLKVNYPTTTPTPGLFIQNHIVWFHVVVPFCFVLPLLQGSKSLVLPVQAQWSGSPLPTIWASHLHSGVESLLPCHCSSSLVPICWLPSRTSPSPQEVWSLYFQRYALVCNVVLLQSMCSASL